MATFIIELEDEIDTAGARHDIRVHNSGVRITGGAGWVAELDVDQRQDSLTDQLRDLVPVAIRMGCYDAADWIRRFVEHHG